MFLRDFITKTDNMWINGLIIGAIILVLAGVMRTIRDVVIMYPHKLKPWMKKYSFFCYHGSEIHSPGKFKKYKGYKKEGGAAFFGSRTIFKFTTNAYYFFDTIGTLTLIGGTILFSISIFFSASSLEGFVWYQLLSVVAAYCLRLIGGYIVEKTCFRQKK